MCGICGIVDLKGRGVDEAGLADIQNTLRHRGPDDSGTHVDRFAGLGHRRLSIIDLSEAARQPIPNENNTVWLICNGEIYNHHELRKQLEDAGHRFRSGSDNEVLVHGYEQWGLEATLHRLKGMFAFAIWDTRSKTLWLARDRLGVKPLYYFEDNGRLAFSSEIRGLYAYRRPSADSIDRLSLDYFLSFGYVPPDRTIIRGISKLPPAHVLRYGSDGAQVSQYWDVGLNGHSSEPREHTIVEVEEKLAAAVSRRLESDVPLGSFLSAGIDSGLVTAMAAKALGSQLKTFTVAFDRSPADEDEREMARVVSQRYGTLHQELVVEPGDRSDLALIMWHAGEPFADISVLPSFQMSRAARGEVTVALTGDGGDESFCGYYNVYAAYLAGKLKRWLPAQVRGGLSRLLDTAGGRVSGNLPLTRRLATLIRYSVRSPLETYEMSGWWNTSEKPVLYDPGWLKGQAGIDAQDVVGERLSRVESLDEVEQILYTDLHLRLPGDYLTKMDIASNIVALEIRSPYLDHELVEYAAALPPSMRMSRWRQKGLLRNLARKYLPAQVYNRPKTGFAPPLGSWLRTDWAPLVAGLLGDSRAVGSGLFNGLVVRRTVKEHVEGTRDHTQRVWSLLCFEIWWRMFVDGTMGPDTEL
ncbi:MAG: asparagine synthase (glutamine-hydrolyzing) [Chloroflexi bacterium]|nr:asparagine synthase (glutamine-hydrolyzing) [Chloroflexota bacterium]